MALRAALAVLLIGIVVVTPTLDASVDARVLVSPLDLSLSLSAGAVTAGKTARATVVATNIADAKLTDVAVTLRADPGGVQIDPGSAQVVRSIRSGHDMRLGFTLCGRTPATYVILARATGHVVGGDYAAESAAVLLTVLPGSGKKCP